MSGGYQPTRRAGVKTQAPFGTDPRFGRREFLGLGAAAALVVAGCGSRGSAETDQRGTRLVPADGAEVRAAERRRRGSKAAVREFKVVAAPFDFDIGGRVVSTWAFSDQIPGPLVRVNRGEVVKLLLKNELPESTAIHWHGIALRNDMDGVPGLTQRAVQFGESFLYEFAVPDAGTYFFHPHVGTQLDRGLYAPMIIDDPNERGDYDKEWIVVLDDWLDGVDGTPDDQLRVLQRGMHGAANGAHDMTTMSTGNGSTSGTGLTSALLGGDAGDVRYPYYLFNGRVSSNPEITQARPGDRVRLRVINAASDTAFTVGLQGHRLTVTHNDGLAVKPRGADSVLVGMGERFDATVTVGTGSFAFIAEAEGKSPGSAHGVLRSLPSAASPRVERIRRGELLELVSLEAPQREQSTRVDRTLDVVLGGSMSDYRWTMNGKTFADSEPLPVYQGERVRLRFENRSSMWHPVHLHGHTFTVPAGGRKDTVIVKPAEKIAVEFNAENPGQWMLHCHNVYHQEAGMLTELSYRS